MLLGVLHFQCHTSLYCNSGIININLQETTLTLGQENEVQLEKANLFN